MSWHDAVRNRRPTNQIVVLNNGLGKHIDLLTPEQLITFAKVSVFEERSLLCTMTSRWRALTRQS